MELQCGICGIRRDGFSAPSDDEVIACIEDIFEAALGGELDDETIAGLNTFYAQSAEQTPGIYMGVYKDGDRIATCADIDFQTTDQTALVNSGMVSGTDQGNMADGRLSLASTIRSFEESGMTCEVMPVYGTEK
jgi:hypothetical protein